MSLTSFKSSLSIVIKMYSTPSFSNNFFALEIYGLITKLILELNYIIGTTLSFGKLCTFSDDKFLSTMPEYVFYQIGWL